MEKIRDQVADVLQDFATIIMEEIAHHCDLHIKEEAAIMERIGRLIRAFREGDTSPENAYRP